MRLHSAIVELTLTPFTKFLQKVLDDIKEVDSASVFACPVEVDEVSSLTLILLLITFFLNIFSMLFVNRCLLIVVLYSCKTDVR